jgi:hypothetical protein
VVLLDSDIEVIPALEIHPKAIGCAEGSRESQRRVGGDRTLAVDDLVDASSGHGDGLREAVLGDAHRGQEFLEEDLSGVDRVVCGSHDVSPLVVVSDLDVGGSGRGPGEADAPLVVDADAVLSLAVAVELFETVAGRDPQVVDGLGGVEDQQLAVRNSLEVGAEFADVRSLPDELGLLVRE